MPGDGDGFQQGEGEAGGVMVSGCGALKVVADE